MVAIIIILTVIAALICLLLTSVRIYTSFKRCEAENKSELVLRWMFINIRIPQKKATVQKKESIKSNSADSDPEALPQKGIKYYKSLYCELREDIARLLSFAKEKAVVIEDLSLSIEFGYDDAALTGIMTGIFNGVVYNVVGYIHNSCNLKNWIVDVLPDFENEKFNVTLDCIVRIKLVHIIRAALMGVKIYIKKSKTDKKGKK